MLIGQRFCRVNRWRSTGAVTTLCKSSRMRAGVRSVVSGFLSTHQGWQAPVTWGQSLRHSSGASPLLSPPHPPDAPSLCLTHYLSRFALPAHTPPPCPFLVLLLLPSPPLAPPLSARHLETGSLISLSWRRWKKQKKKKKKSSTCEAERKPQKHEQCQRGAKTGATETG